MNRNMLARKLVRGLHLFVIAALLAMTLSAPAAPVGATPPISGQTIEFDSSNGVGDVALNFVAIATGDLDNDGWMDLATGSSSTTNELRVWENDGTPFSGTWSGGSGNAVGDTSGQVNSVALGDLDHDGRLDLVSGDNNQDVYIWRNDGTPFSGTWSTNYNIGDGVHDIYGVAMSDFDGDGNLDIVSVSLSAAGSEVIVWENPYTSADTNPFDQTWTAHNVADTTGLHSVAVADVNQDGKVDIIAGNTSNQVRIWSHDGSWTFTSRATLTGDGNIDALALADLNRDGYVDIMSGGTVEGGGTYEVIVWENDADSPFDWSFTEHDTANTADDVNGLAATDFNNDGYPDFAAVTDNGEDNEAIAWENDADATFDWSFTQVDVGATDTLDVRAVTAADFDNDGDADIATGRESGATYEVAAWENDLPHRNMPFDSTATDVGASTTNVYSVALGDLDGDGDLDIVSGSMSDEDYEVIAWENDGTPFSGLWTQNDVGPTHDVFSVALGDLDGDGDLDIVSGSTSVEDYEVIAWQNDGTPFSGYWTQNDVGASTDSVVSVALGDLDGDGDLDIVSGSISGEDYEVITWQNDGSPFAGLWTQNNVGASTDNVYAVALGDLDGDGDLDIVSGSMSGEDYEVITWENDSAPFTGLWMQNDVGASTDHVRSVALGDLDNDGGLDIVSGSFSGEDYEVIAWQNDGTPFSGAWTQNDVGVSTDAVESVALGDLDNDGDLDIVSGSFSGEDYEVIAWQNDGTPFSGAWIQNDMGASTDNVFAVALGDLDGDGDLDIVSGSFYQEDYEVIAWQNIGGSAGLAVSNTAPADILNTNEDDLLKVVFTHNGIAGDRNLELNKFDLDLFRSDCSITLATTEADAIIANLRVRLDDGDDVFETDGSDVLVADVDTLSLTGGVQTVAFIDGDANVQVSATNNKTYWISMLTTANASFQTPNCLCVNFDPDADALVEGKTPDFSVSIQDTVATDSGSVCATGGTIVIEKVTDPAGGTGFEFTNNIPGGPNPFNLNDGGSRTFNNVANGTFAVTETDPAVTPGGHILTGLACVETGTNNSTWDVSTRTVTTTLEAGETITCTFTNKPDTDGDGVPDVNDCCPLIPDPGQEDADGDGVGDACDNCPNDPGNDADGDGVCGDLDDCPNDANADQADLDGDRVGDVCDDTASSRPTSTGSGLATLHTSAGYFSAAAGMGIPCPNPPALDFPHGFFNFVIEGLAPGETAVVTIILPGNMPTITQYWKCGPTVANPAGHWYRIPMGDNDGDDVITIAITDGGDGDDDLAVNGAITEPGGPGQPLFTLTVKKDGGGTGMVTSAPAGIFCGAGCIGDYFEGTPVTLTAHPGVRSYFVGWSGNCSGTGPTTQVTMDADRHCIATFGYPIGGIVVPVNKLGLVAPWMGLAALAGLMALGVVLVSRRRSG